VKYDNLLEVMLEKFPRLKDLYKQEDLDCGLYVVFGFSFMPYIIECLLKHESNEEFLHELFDFFEQMANCEVEEIRELLMYAVLETLGDDINILTFSQNYMGDETKRLSKAIDDFLGR
jgi:hypothetical protein